MEQGLGMDMLWGKSDPTGAGIADRVPMPLLQHLFDTAAVAEQLVDRTIPPMLRGWLDQVAPDGDGRRWLAWVAGLHDVGKASPGFQAVDEELGAAVAASGLPVDRRSRVRHEQVSAWILHRETKEAGWPRRTSEWVAPLLDGHHGRFSKATSLRRPPAGFVDLDGAWAAAQRRLVERFTSALGFRDLAAAAPREQPPRAIQLAIAGLIVTCDWIASNGTYFEGVPFDGCSLDLARDRAEKALEALGLATRWPSTWYVPDDLIQERFGREGSRPYQDEVIARVHTMNGSGLVILEAPMGEGKTEAGMAAAELLAAQTGAHGIVVGMPTQATSDQIFSRLTTWAARMPFDPPLTLLHGRRSLHPDWARLRRPTGTEPQQQIERDPYGMSLVEEPVDPRQIAEDEPGGDGGLGIAQWWDGRYRGLGSDGLAVCTIDQPLLAATRTRFVSLRFAGLVGKVLLLDEIHAADVYMSRFLHELLRWLGQAGVPVVAMSATLPSSQRQALVDAYLEGAEPDRFPTQVGTVGYPQVTIAEAQRGPRSTTSVAWREPYEVGVSLLEAEDDATVPDLLEDLLRDGGCALVVRNTVARAQQTYERLVERFGADEVRLLHARFLADHRSADTAEVVRLLGDGDTDRPRRMVIVGTQVVEQSLDLDADVLISDIAPVDLLLQRAGRLHRHARGSRPAKVATPHVYVVGAAHGPDGPDLEAGARAVYGTLRLARTAALLEPGATVSWTLPDDLPDLVEAVYDDARAIAPPGWNDHLEAAARSEADAERKRVSAAEARTLSDPQETRATTLVGLHARDSKVDTNDDAVAAAAVRDGDPTVEVVVVRRRSGQFVAAADGRPFGIHGEVVRDYDEVAGSTIRLPARLPRPERSGPFELTAAALRLGPLPAWTDHRRLRHLRVWCLDDTDLDAVRLPEVVGTYDRRLGLTLEVRDG